MALRVVVLQSNKMPDSVNAQLLGILGKGASCNSTVSGTNLKQTQNEAGKQIIIELKHI